MLIYTNVSGLGIFDCQLPIADCQVRFSGALISKSRIYESTSEALQSAIGNRQSKIRLTQDLPIKKAALNPGGSQPSRALGISSTDEFRWPLFQKGCDAFYEILCFS